MEDFRSQNIISNNLELVETLKGEMHYLRKKNITKTYIIKPLTENQAIGHVKATTSTKVNQQGTAIQTEVTPKTWPQEERTPQNSRVLVKV